MYALPVDENSKTNLQATPTIESPTTGKHQAEYFNWLYEWYSPGVVMLCRVVCIMVYFFALSTSRTEKKNPDTVLKSISFVEVVFSCVRNFVYTRLVDGRHTLAFDIAFRSILPSWFCLNATCMLWVLPLTEHVCGVNVLYRWLSCFGACRFYVNWWTPTCWFPTVSPHSLSTSEVGCLWLLDLWPLCARLLSRSADMGRRRRR